MRALEQAVQDAVAALVVSAAERAIETIMERWQQVPGASAVAERHALDRIPADFALRARTAVSDWQAWITELLSSDGVAKRSVARFFTYDVEAFGLVLIVGLLGFGDLRPRRSRASAAERRTQPVAAGLVRCGAAAPHRKPSA